MALRDEFLARGWPSASGVCERLGLTENSPELVDQMRRSGRLLGVWSEPAHCYVYPDFQFIGGQIHPAVQVLLATFAELPEFSTAEDRGGWNRVFWLYGQSMELSEASLHPDRLDASDAARAAVDIFADEPQAVIDDLRQMAFPSTHPSQW